MKFSIANDFSKFPAGRTKADGQFSGEHLREKLIEQIEKLNPGEGLIINLDGTMGYGSSFLHAAFISLSKWLKYSQYISFETEDPSLEKEVQSYFSIKPKMKKVKEYKTTSFEFEQHGDDPDPYEPEGDGWMMCGSSASNWKLFWFWVREVEIGFYD